MTVTVRQDLSAFCIDIPAKNVLTHSTKKLAISFGTNITAELGFFVWLASSFLHSQWNLPFLDRVSELFVSTYARKSASPLNKKLAQSFRKISSQ